MNRLPKGKLCRQPKHAEPVTTTTAFLAREQDSVSANLQHHTFTVLQDQQT